MKNYLSKTLGCLQEKAATLQKKVEENESHLSELKSTTTKAWNWVKENPSEVMLGVLMICYLDLDDEVGDLADDHDILSRR